MFRPIVQARPFASVRQFHSQKVAEAFEAAIAHRPQKLAISVANGDRGARRNGALNLEANAGEGDVFQVGDTPLFPATCIEPGKLNQLRAEKPISPSAVLCIFHNSHIGTYFRDT